MGSGVDIQSGNDGGAAGDDRTDLGGVQYDDVLDDGANRGSAGTACDFWDSEYTVVLSQRIDLSSGSVSGVAAGDCQGGSIYVCSAWIQIAAAEGSGAVGDCSGHDLPVDICGGDAGISEVVHGSVCYVAWAGQLAHKVDLAGDAFASGNAGLGPASQNFFDGVESSVIDAFSKGEVERVGGGNMVEREHLKGLEDGKRNVAERIDSGGVEGSCDRATPL